MLRKNGIVCYILGWERRSVKEFTRIWFAKSGFGDNAFWNPFYDPSAHRPLTAGIAVAAGGASIMGVNNVVIGLLVGGFAVSTGRTRTRC